MEYSLFPSGKTLEWHGRWTIADAQKHPEAIFVFGDNDQRYGHGGQAVLRNQPNAMGLRTKKLPSMGERAFYSDMEFETNVAKIQEDLNRIQTYLQEGKNIIFSENGYGTGFAKLNEKAPKTYAYLCAGLQNLGILPSKQTEAVKTWARTASNGYEVSSKGDSRFSALYAHLKDGRSIEEAYQLDVKGYRSQGNDWKLGKGKPPLMKISKEALYAKYLNLWKQWTKENPRIFADLLLKSQGKPLTDCFAKTDISQARALADVINEYRRKNKLQSPVR